ncbi:MAG: ribonuclease D, partial [Anaerolineales bacterium]|nr:ribonuclease D [Anaerolineales bacterium]
MSYRIYSSYLRLHNLAQRLSIVNIDVDNWSNVIIILDYMHDINPAQLVLTDDSLGTVVAKLNRERSIAVDTESNSLHAYKEKVCLIQFSTREEDFIVDPIAVGNLDILRSVFANQSIEKVFHAAEYDLIGLWRDFGWKVDGLFDTMVAARTLGWEKVGLAAILSKHYSVPINKKFQRADWAARPLNDDQLSYAQLDTHYLLKLRDYLEMNIRKHRQWPEVYEEFERISEAS